MTKPTKTGLIYDESYNWHDPGPGALYLSAGNKWLAPDIYYENVNRIRPCKNLLDRSGFTKELAAVEPRPATREELEYFHTPEYIDRIKQLSDTTGGEAGRIVVVGKGSYEIVSLAVGGALVGIDAVMEGKIRNTYSLHRPPGGHALKNEANGFCIFNYFNIMAHYARKKYDLKRIMIIDWDCHHKAGIDLEFYDDPGVLYIETHQESDPGPYDSGYAENVGKGAGRGYNVNIPLPVGTGDIGYVHAFENIIAPIADQYKPELVIVVSGFAANIYDPLGGMQLTAPGYYKLASIVKGIAERNCSGRLVACQEGGFGPYMPFCVLKVLECFSGLKSIVEDPFQPLFDTLPEKKLSIDQSNAISKVKKIQSQFWRL